MHNSYYAEAQPCTMGFPATVSQCTSSDDCGTRESNGNTDITRIIPDMNFTCTGTVTKWRAAGEIDTRGGRNTNAMLGIWRERSSETGMYDRVERIELGTCGSGVQAPLVMGLSNVYECTLPQSERVSVQPGDIIGIEIASDNNYHFRLYFNSANEVPTNYEFNGQVPMFILNQTSSPMLDQPQISLTVEQPAIMSTTVAVLPTTVPLTITQTATDSVDLPMTTQLLPTTTQDSLTVAISQPLTTTRASVTTATTTTSNIETTRAPDTPTTTMTNSPTTMGGQTDKSVTTETSTATTTHRLVTVEESDSITMSADTETIEQQTASNVGTIAGAAVGGIIAVLLVLIIILLLLLVLRRQSRSGQKFTPTNNSTIVNPVYDGKPLRPNLALSISLS